MRELKHQISLPGRGCERLIKCLVMQSPLAGVTDQVFRTLIRRWAPNALLFTEMVNATSINEGKSLYKLDEIRNDNGPLGVQLFDYRPKAMAKAARIAEDSGAFLIDINMGCPVKKVACKGGGSGLIKNPDLAAEIINTVSNAVKIPVTAKTRLGWSNDSSNPIGFTQKLESAGAQMITLHGRTREQGFSGKANWEAIQEVKKSLNIPVIANGDIDTPGKALQCLKTTNADGVMIGRGVMGAPWLIGQINSAIKGTRIIDTPNTANRLELLKEQLVALVNINGDHGLLIARKHISWVCKDFLGASELRASLMKADRLSDAIRLLENQKHLLIQNNNQ